MAIFRRRRRRSSNVSPDRPFVCPNAAIHHPQFGAEPYLSNRETSGNSSQVQMRMTGGQSEMLDIVQRECQSDAKEIRGVRLGRARWNGWVACRERTGNLGPEARSKGSWSHGFWNPCCSQDDLQSRRQRMNEKPGDSAARGPLVALSWALDRFALVSEKLGFEKGDQMRRRSAVQKRNGYKRGLMET
ncbi:hypothetical protein CDEST_06596 [Colletotrichum destructivum]|uniref:Uncharacterized protein n=1 Tax=Colletotrichum destructivum TaxID=34406 RepID=A0AAX4IE09_9PEZI|nr:hypothetical protein CDEST_06596 [Colletotrichum destructivum]